MKKGFTLVELLVVMAIIGILTTLVASNFRNSQIRGRDVVRKSDLKQLSEALDLFYSDHGRYPAANAAGEIMGCSYVPTDPSTSANCTWGDDQMGDGNTVYFSTLPVDPVDLTQNYYYRIVDTVLFQSYQIFARLENSKDKSCLEGNCTAPSSIPLGADCGTGITCNFAITSPNVTAAD